jgi:RNA-directed DNA polymerase
VWRQRHHPDIPFERDADDAVCHGQSADQAQRLRQELEPRVAACRLELHPQKTTMVSGKDAERRGTYPHERFAFLGDTFRPRRAKHRWGTYWVNCSPAASAEATRALRRELRRWHLHTRRDKSLEDLSRMVNPGLRGWVNYASRLSQSALYPTFPHRDRSLGRWARRKSKRLRGHQRRAAHWLRRIARRQPALFAHWRLWYAAAGRSEPDEPRGSRPVP